MFNLKEIKVIEYLRLDENELNNYNNLQKVMLPKDHFNNIKAKGIGDLTFSEVKGLQSSFKEPTFEDVLYAYNLFFGVNKHQFLRSSIIDFFYSSNWITQTLLKTVENEAKALQSSDSDPDMELAGSGRLAIFGELNTLFDLGERYSKDPTEIGGWKYNTVFSILVHDKVIGEVRREYQRIKSKKV